jgi:uncharacterized protein YggE
MKKYILLLLFYTPMVFCQFQTKDNLISVTGYAEREVEPDIIVLSMSAKESENSENESSTAKMEINILNFLKSIGINPENFTLDRYNANRRYSLASGTKIKFYKSYKLIFNNVSKLDTITTKCLESGMENLNIQQVNYSKRDSLENVILESALESAQNKAQIIGKTLHSKVLKVYSVSENTQNTNNYTGLDNLRMEEVTVTGYGVQAKSRVGSDLSIQKLKYSKTINVKFEIE